jgi:hypothetical protein
MPNMLNVSIITFLQVWIIAWNEDGLQAGRTEQFEIHVPIIKTRKKEALYLDLCGRPQMMGGRRSPP